MLHSIVIDDKCVERTIRRRRRGDISAGGEGAGIQAHDVVHRRAGLCTYYGEIVDAWGEVIPKRSESLVRAAINTVGNRPTPGSEATGENVADVLEDKIRAA